MTYNNIMCFSIKKYLCCIPCKKSNVIPAITNNHILNTIEEKLSSSTTNSIPEFSLNELNTAGKIVEVYDGDTCKIILINDNNLLKFSCRLNFIDCPEMKPLKTKVNRELEIKNAIIARNRLIQLSTNCKCDLDNTLSKSQIKELLKTNTKIVRVKCYKFDKYGRLLVEIFSDKQNSINNILIEEKHAKPYDGGTKNEFLY